METDAIWSNAAGVFDNTVAESTIALLRSCMPIAMSTTPSPATRRCRITSPYLHEDKTVAIIGAKRHRQRLITMLSGFGPRIIAVNRSGNAVPGADETYPISEVDKVWPEADYFVLIAPLTRRPTTWSTKTCLPRCRITRWWSAWAVAHSSVPGSFSSAGLWRDCGAALDVTEPEPLPDDHPLWKDPRVVITRTLPIPVTRCAAAGSTRTAKVARGL